MRQLLILFCILLVAPMARANDYDTSAKPEKKSTSKPRSSAKPKKVDREPSMVKSTRDMRKSSYGSLMYAPVVAGLLLPSKKGYSASFLLSKDLDVYVEYIKGELGFAIRDIQLVNFKESLLAVNARYYYGFNSFYTVVGLAKRQYNLRLGDDSLEDFNFSQYPASVEVIDVSNYVLNLGLGNRWIFDFWGIKGPTFGCDWLVLQIPVSSGTQNAPVFDYIESDSTKEKLDDVMTVLRYLPTFFIKIELGWTF